MKVSIEVPVIKGQWLIACIDSILNQTSADWRLSLLWDGGDEASRAILERVERLRHPRLAVYYRDRAGIAASRRFLTERSAGELILPVDDDDLLAPTAIAELLAAAEAMPWAGLIRARRGFIDEAGRPVEMDDWFPFTPRRFERGMTCDLYNQAHPYLIRRSAYVRTMGWEGFADFRLAGEDCDIFLKIEEVAAIELLDRRLYYYRLHLQRTSHHLGPTAAEEMWRRLADRTLARRGLPLARTNAIQPFSYRRLARRRATLADVECVVPFFEADREELPYDTSRPSAERQESLLQLTPGERFIQELPEAGFDQVELALSAPGPVAGALAVEVHYESGASPVAAEHEIDDRRPLMRFVHLDLAPPERRLGRAWLHVSFRPRPGSRHAPGLHLLAAAGEGGRGSLLMRLFRRAPGFSRRQLERCLASLARAGLDRRSLHVVERRQSSAANKNEGLRRTERSLVCFVDDDVEIPGRGDLEVLCARLDEDDADLIGPKIVDPAGRIFSSDPYFDAGLFPKPRGIGEEDRGQYDYASEVPWLPSTFLLARREVCKSLGGFDEGYPGSQLEDVDFCLQARQKGFRCCYAGDAKIIHFNQQRNDRFSENVIRFHRRWQRHADLLAAPRPARPAVQGVER
jgi:Glycosyl transferase family 2/Glycosyltransferase like family 2